MCWNVRIELDRLKMVYCTTILFSSKRILHDLIRLCFVGKKKCHNESKCLVSVLKRSV